MRLAVIGGGFGATHLTWAGACGGLRVSHLCYLDDAQRARSLARQFGIAETSDDPLGVISSGSVDAVAVVTPPASHEPFLTAGLEAGLIVVSDKPLAAEIAAATRLAEKAALLSACTMVTFQWRRNRALRRLRQTLAAGELGRVFWAEFAFHHDFLAGPQTRWPWRHRRSSAGAGALADQGVHLFDLVRWMFPGAWIVSDGYAAVQLPRRFAGRSVVECETEDVAEVHLNQEPTGIRARVLVSRVSAGYRAVQVGLHGTTGTAVVRANPDNGQASLSVHLAGAPSPRISRVPAHEMNPYTCLTAATESADDVATFDDGLAAQRLLHETMLRVDERAGAASAAIDR